MIERKLAAWQAAGLIDAETTARIKAWEGENARPLALWAVIGIGVLTIGLGLVSVVAANWDAIPGVVRLALHFVLMAVAAGVLWWRGDKWASANPWVGEALLFVLGMLGLTFFGHLGQVYQSSSPLWQPLSVWLVLFTPLIMLRGQSWLTALLLAFVVIYACIDFTTGGASWLEGGGSNVVWPNWAYGLALGLPVMLAPAGAWLRANSDREDFARRLEQLGFTYALIAASVLLGFATVGGIGVDQKGALSLQSQMVQAVVGLIAAALVGAWRRTESGRSSAFVIAISSIALVIAHWVTGMMLEAALMFLLLWTGVAAAALRGGWRGAFQLAVAMVALRLIVLSFELGGDLLTSGAGLIMSGVLILGIAFAAVRISRRYAPPADDDGDSTNTAAAGETA